MVAIKAQAADAFLKSPDPRIAAILFCTVVAIAQVLFKASA